MAESVPAANSLKLVELTPDMEAAYLSFRRVLQPEDPRHRWLIEYTGEPFWVMVSKLQDWKQGRQLPRGWVPCSTFYLVDENGMILGKSSLRHELNSFLRHIGGHIGYVIRPDRRRNGYGTAILRLTLEKAAERGLQRVLVTCDADNDASAKIIEKNGGLLEDEYQDADLAVPKRRYWIELQGIEIGND